MDLDPDRTLASLALESKLVTPEQYSVAFEAWSRKKTGTLLDHLAERGYLGASDRDQLMRLAGREAESGETQVATIAATGLGGNSAIGPESAATVALAEPPSDRPRPHIRPDRPATPEADANTHATIDQPTSAASRSGSQVPIFDQRAGQETLEGTPPGEGMVRVKSIADAGGSTDRYTRTKLHAEGGLGMVWMARDQAIGREVALKELRPKRNADPRLWARFLEEARITGQLEHPSIVPIYELAEDPETGRPYYTMRFIRGGTLTDACAAYRQARAEGKDDPLTFRSLLTSFVGICQAVAYAHSRGVIHRDLKGQNVVLGDFGEVIVLDWGLAKVIGRPDDAEAAPIAAADDDRSAHETLDGQVFGTPAFMPPEQALGLVDQIDRRSDIYSLGAILYEILAGRSPVTGASTTEILKNVAEGRIDPPRSVDPAVPPALQAICLKALAKGRDDRYQTAGDLAREVQRYLGDEPVLAYPEPWTTRALRWSRKHRSAVAAAAACLVAAVGLLSVSTILIGRERDRVRVEREIASQAADDMYTDVAEQWLEDQSDPLQQKFLDRALVAYQKHADDAPEIGATDETTPVPKAASPDRNDHVDALQKSFLERSLVYYDRAANRPADGLADRLKAAQARVRVANIDRKLGKIDDAGREYDRSIRDLIALTRQAPEVADAARTLATARSRFGAMKLTLGDFAEADELLAQAETSFRTLSGSVSGVDRDRLEWGRTLREQAERLKLAGQTKPAEATFRESIGRLSSLVEGKFPGVEARHELALAQDALGVMLLVALDRRGEAAALLSQAMAIEEALVKESPTVAHLRAGLAKTANTLSLILWNEGRTADAMKPIEVCLANIHRLSEDFPGRHEYRRSLARAYINRGTFQRDEGQVDAAKASYGEAADLLTKLVQDNPEIVKHRRDLGSVLRASAGISELQDKLDEAIASYTKAEAVDATLVDQHPSVPQYREYLGIVRRSLARVLSKPGKTADDARATRLAADARTIFEGLNKSYPQIPSYQRGLAACDYCLGYVHFAGGRAKDAEVALLKAVSRLRPLAEADPNAATQRELITALFLLATVGDSNAEALDREVLSRSERLCKMPGATNADRFTLAQVLNNLGEDVEKAGRAEESQALFARAEKAFEEQGLGGSEPQRFHYLAYVMTNRGKLARSQGRLDEAQNFFRLALDRDLQASKLQPASYKSFLPDDYENLGSLLIARGDHVGASKLAAEMIDAMPGSSSARVAAAGLLARCVDVARKEKDRGPDRDTLARSYATKGIAQLRVVLDSGSKRIDAIKADPNLQGLLKEPESRQILPDLVGTSS